MPVIPRTPHGVWTQLRRARTDGNWTLTHLADAAGISLSYLSDLERGRQLPSPEAVRKLAVALNMPVSLLERERHVDENGADIALCELIRRIVQEELEKAAAA